MSGSILSRMAIFNRRPPKETPRRPAPSVPLPWEPIVGDAGRRDAGALLDQWDAALGSSSDAVWDALDAMGRRGGSPRPQDIPFAQGNVDVEELRHRSWRWWALVTDEAADAGDYVLATRVGLFMLMFVRQIAPNMRPIDQTQTGFYSPQPQLLQRLATTAAASSCMVSPVEIVAETRDNTVFGHAARCMLVDFVASLDGTATACLTTAAQATALSSALPAVGRHSLRGELDAAEAFAFYREWIPGLKTAFEADTNKAYAQLVAAAAEHGDWSWVGAAHLMDVMQVPGYHTDPRFSEVMEQACTCMRARHIPTAFLTTAQHSWWLSNHPDESWLATTTTIPESAHKEITPLGASESRHIATLAGGNRILAHREGGRFVAHMERQRAYDDPTRVLDSDPLEDSASLEGLYSAVANAVTRLCVVDWADPQLTSYFTGPLADFTREPATPRVKE